jgi:hypothetical protein
LLVKVNSLSEDTLPIVCGGTHYYTQHFLFPPSALSIDRPEGSNAGGRSKVLNSKWLPPCALEDIEKEGLMPCDLSAVDRQLLNSFYNPDSTSATNGCSEISSSFDASAAKTSAMDSEAQQLLDIHRLLQRIDPQEASRWHWKDGRKVRRGVERWWENRADQITHKRNDGVNSAASPASAESDSGKAR